LVVPPTKEVLTREEKGPIRGGHPPPKKRGGGGTKTGSTQEIAAPQKMIREEH